MPTSFRRLADCWPLEPGNSLLIVFATLLGVVRAFTAFPLALDVVNPSLGVDGIGDIVRIAPLLPWFVLVFMVIVLQRISYAPDSSGVVLLIAVSGAVTGALVGLLGVAWLHRG